MRQFVERNKPYFPAAFFIGGFLFDLLTLARIDEGLQLIQQFIYLIIIGWLLIAEKSPNVEKFFLTGFRNKIWTYRYEIIHFLLGSLLSVYTIFYFKSASMFSSFVFIGVLSAILVLNELEKIKGLGSTVRFTLFAMCSCSYFIYLVPILWQHIGLFTFIFSIIVSGIFFTCIFYFLSKYEHLSKNNLLAEVVLPGIGVHILFFFLYVIGYLPPVPLSIEKIGVYHDLKKIEGSYHLYYERPWWKFWQKGAQSFVAGPNDKIHAFASVFAPNFFKEQVAMEWWLYGRGGWTRTDSIPIQIAGGRDIGYRGYTVKSNFDEGDWQVRVVTSDGREIGRIYFNVAKNPAVLHHEYEVDVY